MSRKYFQTSAWFLAPILVLAIVYAGINLIMAGFSLPPLLDDLPSTASDIKRIAFNSAYLLTLLLLVSFYLVLPVCWIIGFFRLIRIRKTTPKSANSAHREV